MAKISCTATLALTLLLALVAVVTPAEANQNVTLDDSSSEIHYVGNWMRSTFAQSPLNYGGSHVVTTDPTASAVVSFNGTAIYFLSPRWPFDATTQVTLDNSAPILIDLADRLQAPSPNITMNTSRTETVQSQVVWSKTGLTNTQHTLRVSVGQGQPFAIVDAIMYTTASSSSPSAAAAASRPSHSTLAIALSSVCAGAALSLLIAGALCYRRRRRHLKASRVAGWATGSRIDRRNLGGSRTSGRHGDGKGAGIGMGIWGANAKGSKTKPMHASSASTSSKHSSTTQLDSLPYSSVPSPAHLSSAAAGPDGAPLPAFDPSSQQSLAAYYAWAQAHAASGVPPPPMPVPNTPPSAWGYNYTHTQPRYTIATLSTITEASLTASPWSTQSRAHPQGSPFSGYGGSPPFGYGPHTGVGEFGTLPLPPVDGEKDASSSQYFTPRSRVEGEDGELLGREGEKKDGGPPGYTPRQ